MQNKDLTGNEAANMIRQTDRQTEEILDFGFYNMDCMEGMKRFPDKYFDLAIVDPPFRVSKQQIIWGANNFMLPPYKGFIVWKKKTISENFTMSMAEIAYISDGLGTVSKVYECQPQRINEKRIHPTQKPVELYKWVIGKYAKNGDIILDTHVGSASSLIACRETGHKYVGFEIDKEYYESAKKRLNAAEAQVNIFDFGFNPYQE